MWAKNCTWEKFLASFAKICHNRWKSEGLPFEEKTFYDIGFSLWEQYNFDYGTDKEIDSVAINDKYRALNKKSKDNIDTQASFATLMNN